MKNKILVIFLVILITIGLLFITNLIRNFIILKNLYNISNNFDFGINYYIAFNTNTTHGNSKIEQYLKNDISLSKFSTNNRVDYIIWNNKKTKEIVYLIKDENGNIVQKDMEEYDAYSYVNSIKFAKNNSFKDILITNLFNIITTEKNTYKIKTKSYIEYIDKDKGLVEKQISKKNNVSVEILYTENNVTENNIKKPEGF